MLITEVSHKKLVKGFRFYTTSFWKYFDLCYELNVCVCVLSRFSHVQVFATLWTITCQVLLSMGLSRGEYWSGWPCLPPGESSQPRDRTRVSYIFCIGRQVLHHQCHHPATKFLGESPKWWHLEIWPLGGI